MAFNDYEQSRHDARPAELLEIRYGNDTADIMRFTFHDHDLTLGGNLYQSVAMERDTFDDEGNPDDGTQLNIRLPYANDFADIYRGQDFATAITVKLRAVHLSDPDLQITARWSGRITGVSWERPHMVLGCERISTSLNRAGLTARYEVGRCRHVHYQPGCWLDRASFAVAGTAEMIVNGRNVTVPEAAASPDGWFTGGILEHQGVMRWILSHSGSLLVLSGPLLALAATNPVTLYPGCDRTRGTCAAKFFNVGNYGGFDFLNPNGPFSGNSIV